MLASFVKTWASIRARERRHIGKPLVHQLGVALVLGRDVNDDTVNGLPLARVAGHGIAVVEVRVLAEVEVDGFPGFQAKAEISAGIDLLNVPKLSVGDVLTLERRRELDSLVFGKLPLFPVIDIDTLEPLGIVGDSACRPRGGR